jgi:hypothetical protein
MENPDPSKSKLCQLDRTLGGRPTTRSEQPPTCRDRNWIAVVGPGTYGRGAALYVARAGRLDRAGAAP